MEVEVVGDKDVKSAESKTVGDFVEVLDAHLQGAYVGVQDLDGFLVGGIGNRLVVGIL